MSRTDDLIDSYFRNQRFTHHDIKVVMVPFEHPRMLSKRYFEQRASSAVDRNLSNEGKDKAVLAARSIKDTAVHEWLDQRLKDIDAHRLEQRAALLADTTVPEPKRVELMASQLLKHNPADIPIFYNSANETERRLMEAASAFVGRVPVVSANGKEWKPLLDPEMVNEAILARAEATNPTAAQKVRELDEIRAMHVTVANVALSEI